MDPVDKVSFWESEMISAEKGMWTNVQRWAMHFGGQVRDQLDQKI